MATPPDSFALNPEDVAGLQRPDKLLVPLNGFVSDVSSALTGLTFKENMLCTLKTVRLVIPSSPPWRSVGATGNPAFQNSWVNFSASDNPAGFYVTPGGRVWLRGSVKDGTVNATIFNFPVGYRPPLTESMVTVANDALGRISIATNGNIRLAVGSNAWAQLDNLSFNATAPAPPDAFAWNETPLIAHGLPSVAGVIPVGCAMKDAAPGQSNGHFTIDWEDVGDGRIKIKSAWGLQWGQTYFVNLLIFAG